MNASGQCHGIYTFKEDAVGFAWRKTLLRSRQRGKEQVAFTANCERSSRLR